MDGYLEECCAKPGAKDVYPPDGFVSIGFQDGFAGVPSCTGRRAYVRRSLMFCPILITKLIKSVVVIVPHVLGCLI